MSNHKPPEILLTAQQAFPVLERAFLTAKHDIHGSFRTFDPLTPLWSDAALRTGPRWLDLVADTLARGVRIDLTLADFDPVVRPDMHRASWKSFRIMCAAAEMSGRPDLLTMRVCMHPARIGWLARLALWPRTYNALRGIARDLNGLAPVSRTARLRDQPYLKGMLCTPDGAIAAKPWPPVALAPATHHQKLAVFDTQSVFIGGLDLDERRFDSMQHDRPADETWHDVNLMIHDTGLGRTVRDHLACFWKTGAPVPDLPSRNGFVRTFSTPRKVPTFSMSPASAVTEILAAHCAEADRSQRLIYVETQYFRDPALTAT